MTDTGPQPGDPAPDFSYPRDGGTLVSLADLRGGPVVVYFYPRDDTSGCTAEARDFTAQANDFASAGATVVGVSKDTVATHEKFRDKYDLGIALVSDADGDLCERYGVWVEKKMYGRTFMGIERATFLIDLRGTVARVWRRVKVPGHVDDVLAAVRSL